VNAVQLMWVRLVVDDFASALRFHHEVMSLQGKGEETAVEHGYARLWNCSDNQLEVELIQRSRAEEILGGVGIADDVTLVYHAHDLDDAVAWLTSAGGLVVLPPRDRPGYGSKVAQLRDPTGRLVELLTPYPIPSFGGPLELGTAAS